MVRRHEGEGCGYAENWGPCGEKKMGSRGLASMCLDEERFPTCSRDDVGVGVSGVFSGLRLPVRVGVDDTG